MKKARRNLPPKQPSHLNLPARRGEQILSADHQINALVEVIHHHRELIGPLAETIADQNIAALIGGGLLDSAEAQVFKALDLMFQSNASRRFNHAVH